MAADAPPTAALSAVQVGVSVTLALGLLALFLWQVPLAEVGAALGGLHLGWVGAAVGLALLSYLLRALRWGVILRPVGPAPWLTLFGSTAAGFATSTILPGRLGELVRPLLLARQARLSAAGCLASIVAERLIDMASLLTMFAVGVGLAGPRLAPGAAGMLRPAAALAAAAVAVAFVLVLLLLHFRHTAVPPVARLAPRRWRGRVEGFLHHLLDGLEAVRNLRRLALLAVWSAAVWGAAIWQFEVLARGFGMALGFWASAMAIGVSVVGLAVPTPAGVGSFHAALQFSLTALLGAGVAEATAFALVHHAVCFFPITALGLLYLAALGFRPRTAAALAAPPRG